MKKTIFAIVILSIFAINGLALAKSPSTNTSSSEDMWIAINDLRDQVYSLQTELKKARTQNSETETAIDPVSAKKRIVVENGDEVSRSEHYIMKGFSIP